MKYLTKRINNITRLAKNALKDGIPWRSSPGMVYLETLKEGDRFLVSNNIGTILSKTIAEVTVIYENYYSETREVNLKNYKILIAPKTQVVKL